ncbi:MAG: hypothetical protein CVU89_03460 [Firmicutes bacterium HGW-Firmicutes-14]|jgi:hypothetical protein|nr:MAG: hypothetical protein CVU89_03460 [Firmicutes bacterium HGW-Firmicutes-14]
MPELKFTVVNGKNKWPGKVTRFKNHGSHYAVHAESRSGITFIIGEYEPGWFISVPAYGIGADLSSYPTDIFYNTESLVRNGMNKVDAVTVAYAINALAQAGMI